MNGEGLTLFILLVVSMSIMYDKVYANGPTGTELADLSRNLREYSSSRGGTSLSQSIVEGKLGVDFITYLDSDDYKFQEDRWVDAFRAAAREVVTQGREISMVLTNAPYFRKSRFFPPAIVDVLGEYSPKAVITFIEEGHVAWARIRRREERHKSRSVFRLKDMFTWRSVSIMHAATIARHLRVPHYIFPVKLPASDLYRLLSGIRPMVYLSFPITHVREDERAVREINEFRAYMHRRFCSFDPLLADDRVPQHVYRRGRGRGEGSIRPHKDRRG